MSGGALSHRQRRRGVQQNANLVEQFIELEWLRQELEAFQVRLASGAQQR
jgi:hypothetical protein